MKRSASVFLALMLTFLVCTSSFAENSNTIKVGVGKVSFEIPNEFVMTSQKNDSVMFKARQDQVVGWIVQFSLYDASVYNLSEDVDLENNYGHVYKILDGLINQKQNINGIVFDEYNKDMTMINQFPCVILRATTGNMQWYEFVVYNDKAFSKMAFVANIADTEAETVFDTIMASVTAK